MSRKQSKAKHFTKCSYSGCPHKDSFKKNRGYYYRGKYYCGKTCARKDKQNG